MTIEQKAKANQNSRGEAMTGFEEWWEEQYGYDDYGTPPEMAVNAYKAGLERAAEIADRNNIYPFDVADAIRKEIEGV